MDLLKRVGHTSSSAIPLNEVGEQHHNNAGESRKSSFGGFGAYLQK